MSYRKIDIIFGMVGLKAILYVCLHFSSFFFSIIDLYATMLLLQHNIIREGNAIADMVLHRYGFPGFIVMKIALILIVLFCSWMVARSNYRLGLGLLWAGILIMAVVILRHIAIMGVSIG